jgi:predicted negative regulator of RcsB-dependent stress response
VNELAAIEQAERIKKYCREYGFSTVLGIIFAILISWGWHYWRQAQENYLLTASMQYERLLAAIMKNENITMQNNIAEGLLKKYPHTPYASLAALLLAKQAVHQNNLTDARHKLFWVIKHGEDQKLRSIARIRLIRILLAENQVTQALSILAEDNDPTYSPIFLEEKGDILINLGRSKEALQNYLAAKQAFSKNNIEQPLLEMKINNLDYA